MIYLMNSAVMPAENYGRYIYRPASLEDLRAVLQGDYTSAIGYPQNADLIARWTGVRVPVHRIEVRLEPGDRAFVMRLRTRVANPATKGAPVSDDPRDWEFAWVEFVGDVEERTSAPTDADGEHSVAECGECPSCRDWFADQSADWKAERRWRRAAAHG